MHKYTNIAYNHRCIVALDEVTDPQNLGAILRTCHFLGVSEVVLCAKNSAPLGPTVSKASAGLYCIGVIRHFRVDWWIGGLIVDVDK